MKHSFFLPVSECRKVLTKYYFESYPIKIISNRCIRSYFFHEEKRMPLFATIPLYLHTYKKKLYYIISWGRNEEKQEVQE